MHSFDNSENVVKRNNNWFLLEKFFKKNGLEFKVEEYKDIKNGNFEQLVSFMSTIYKSLTKRTYSAIISEPRLTLMEWSHQFNCLKSTKRQKHISSLTREWKRRTFQKT